MKQRKKLKVSNPDDLVYAFWRKYEEADLLKRKDLLKPIVKNFKSMVEIKDEKLRQYSLTSFLQSYFDDLLDYCSCKDLVKRKRGI